MKIHFACMTQNELHDLVRNVELVLPYVDSITIVDGGSIDGTVPYMRNLSRQNPKVRFFIHPWKDNFPSQRNNYLARVSEIAIDGDWVLAVDPDEYLDEIALRQLREIARVVYEKPEHFVRVGFQCRSVSLKGPERCWVNVDDYHKGLFFRWSPKVRYGHNGEGAVHERIDNADPIYFLGHHPEFPALFYEHVKQQDQVWPRGLRNMFIGGGGKNLGWENPSWVELRAITDRLGLTTWHLMNAYLLAGSIAQELKDWMIRHRHETGYDGASEVREAYKTFFRMYHPEEEPVELRGEAIE